MTLCHLPLSILSNFRPLFTFTPNNKILSNKNPNKILSFNKLNNKKRKQTEIIWKEKHREKSNKNKIHCFCFTRSASDFHEIGKNFSSHRHHIDVYP